MLSRMLRPRQLLLYASNPAVVLAGAGQGHGEAAMVLFLALTLFALKNKRGIWASVWLACAGGVKLYPFLLFPFLWRRFGWKSIAAGLGMAILPALPFFHPEGIGKILSSLNLYVRLFEFNAGLVLRHKAFPGPADRNGSEQAARSGPGGTISCRTGDAVRTAAKIGRQRLEKMAPISRKRLEKMAPNQPETAGKNGSNQPETAVKHG